MRVDDSTTRHDHVTTRDSTRRGDLSGAWRRLDRRGDASHFVGTLIGTAMFPRLAYRLRWPTRLRGVKLAAYVAVNVLLMLSFREFAGRWFRRRAQLVDALTAELGREPSPEEVGAAWDRSNSMP
jgi:hypothetical protein